MRAVLLSTSPFSWNDGLLSLPPDSLLVRVSQCVGSVSASVSVSASARATAPVSESVFVSEKMSLSAFLPDGVRVTIRKSSGPSSAPGAN